MKILSSSNFHFLKRKGMLRTGTLLTLPDCNSIKLKRQEDFFQCFWFTDLWDFRFVGFYTKDNNRFYTKNNNRFPWDYILCLKVWSEEAIAKIAFGTATMVKSDSQTSLIRTSLIRIPRYLDINLWPQTVISPIHLCHVNLDNSKNRQFLRSSMISESDTVFFKDQSLQCTFISKAPPARNLQAS